MRLSTELCGGCTLSAFAPKAPPRGGKRKGATWDRPVAPNLAGATRDLLRNRGPCAPAGAAAGAYTGPDLSEQIGSEGWAWGDPHGSPTRLGHPWRGKNGSA